MKDKAPHLFLVESTYYFKTAVLQYSGAIFRNAYKSVILIMI